MDSFLDLINQLFTGTMQWMLRCNKEKTIKKNNTNCSWTWFVPMAMCFAPIFSIFISEDKSEQKEEQKESRCDKSPVFTRQYMRSEVGKVCGGG